MDNKNFYDWVMSHEKVYSLLYSPTKIDNKSVREQLFEVKTKDLDWSLDHNSFVYIWGWPGLGESWMKDERYKFLNVKIMNIRKDLLLIEVGLFQKS